MLLCAVLAFLVCTVPLLLLLICASDAARVRAFEGGNVLATFDDFFKPLNFCDKKFFVDAFPNI